MGCCESSPHEEDDPLLAAVHESRSTDTSDTSKEWKEERQRTWQARGDVYTQKLQSSSLSPLSTPPPQQQHPIEEEKEEEKDKDKEKGRESMVSLSEQPLRGSVEAEERKRREIARQKREEVIRARAAATQGEGERGGEGGEREGEGAGAGEGEVERVRREIASHTHTFTEYTFKRPTHCRFCFGFIFGVYRQGCVCTVCSIPTHDTCAVLLTAEAKEAEAEIVRKRLAKKEGTPQSSSSSILSSLEDEFEQLRRDGDIHFCHNAPVMPARWQEEIEMLKKRERESRPVGSSKEHRFNPYTFLSPTYCRFCCKFIFGVHKQGVLCGDCGYPSHTHCADKVKVECSDVVRSLDEWSVEIKEIREKLKVEEEEEEEEEEDYSADATKSGVCHENLRYLSYFFSLLELLSLTLTVGSVCYLTVSCCLCYINFFTIND